MYCMVMSTRNSTEARLIHDRSLTLTEQLSNDDVVSAIYELIGTSYYKAVTESTTMQDTVYRILKATHENRLRTMAKLDTQPKPSCN